MACCRNEEIARYDALRWHMAPRIVPHDLLDEVRSAIESHQMGWRDGALPGDARFSDWRPEDDEGVHNNEFCLLQNDVVRKLVMLSILGAAAAHRPKHFDRP